MKMWVYVVRRALLIIPVIIGVMTITFGLVSALSVEQKLLSEYGPSKIGYSPTVACSVLTQNSSTPGTCPNPVYQRGVHALGLDKPIPVQWGIYIYRSLTLQWGFTNPNSQTSHAFQLGNTSIATVLSWYLPYTLELAALSLVLILALAIPIGNYSAVYRNRPLDQGARIFSFSGFALPGFLLATILLLGVTFALGNHAECNGQSFPFNDVYGSWPPQVCFSTGLWPTFIQPHGNTGPTGFPTIDALLAGQYWLAGDTLFRMLMPAFVIAFGSIAAILRFVRNSMLEVMNLDFVRTARAKGVPEPTVVRRHAGRNSLNVTITVLGLTFAGFIGGFPIVESVFHLYGVGLMLTYSIQAPYDFGLIFGSTLLFTIIVVIANIMVDILYAYLDPRVRLG